LRKPPLPELSLAAAALLLSGLLAELYLRRFHPIHGMIYALHPRYLHTLVPGSRRLFVRQPVDGGRALLVTVSPEGFLGPPLRSPPAPRRVVVYGDSFVAGEFSPLEERFADRLGRHLTVAGGPEVEVVNAGVAGYGPDQAALRLEDEIAPLRPDLVVVTVFAGNDFGDLVRNRIFRLDPQRRLREGQPRPSARLRAEFEEAARQTRGSMLLRGLAEVFVERPPHELLPPGGYAYLLQRRRRELALSQDPRQAEVDHVLGDPYDADLSLEPGSDSALYKSALMEGVLGRLVEIAARGRVPLLFVFVPSAHDVGEGYEPPDPARFPDYRPSALTDALAVPAIRHGWPHLDLYPIFAAARPERLYFQGDEHWNARGQDLAAAHVAALVRARGLLAQ
jgi:hypothetical protein